MRITVEVLLCLYLSSSRNRQRIAFNRDITPYAFISLDIIKKPAPPLLFLVASIITRKPPIAMLNSGRDNFGISIHCKDDKIGSL